MSAGKVIVFPPLATRTAEERIARRRRLLDEMHFERRFYAKRDYRDAVVARKQWRAGVDSGRADAVEHLLHGTDRDGNPTIFRDALTTIALELKLQRAAARSLGWQSDHWRAKFLEAMCRVVELARKLDALAPGWDDR